MAGQRVWFARDCWLTADPKVQVLGDEHGAAGILAFEELLAAAKLERAGGRFSIRFAPLGRRALLRGPKEARKVIETCVEVGLLDDAEVREKGASARIAMWARWQVTDPTNAERQARHRNAESNAGSNGARNGPAALPRNAAVTKSIQKTEDSEGSNEPSRRKEEGREDVDGLCALLAGLIRENGRPDHLVGWPSDKWRRECRLLLDREKRPPGEVTALIRWCQGDSFWKGNVLSMPTFRKQYDKLRLKAEGEGALRKVEDWQPGMDEASRRKLEQAQR